MCLCTNEINLPSELQRMKPSLQACGPLLLPQHWWWCSITGGQHQEHICRVPLIQCLVKRSDARNRLPLSVCSLQVRNTFGEIDKFPQSVLVHHLPGLLMIGFPQQALIEQWKALAEPLSNLLCSRFFNPSFFFFFVVNFVIHWNETAMGLHVFPIPIPPPTSSPPAPSRSSQCTRSERLSHASNLGWWSVSQEPVSLKDTTRVTFCEDVSGLTPEEEEGRVLGHRNRQMNAAGFNEGDLGYSLVCQSQYNFPHLLE